VSALQPQVEQLTYELASRLAFSSFKRERLNRSLDDVIGAHVRLFQLSQLVGRLLWIEGASTDVETRFRMAEETVHEQTARLEVAVHSVAGFGVLSGETVLEWRTRSSPSNGSMRVHRAQ
jgi:hypothetical protein